MGITLNEIRLSRLYEQWKWNADLMDCRDCGRGIHITRADEELRHRAGCSNEGAPNPWAVLREALTPEPEAP